MKKVLYFIFAISLVIWLGGSVIRNVIIFDLFVPGTELTYKNFYTSEIIDYNIYLFISASTYTSISYILAFLVSNIILIMERKYLKNQGWLFMSIVLFLLVSPIVIYNIYNDFSISRALFYNDLSFMSSDIKSTIFNRYKSNLNTILSGISYLANFTIIAFSIWKPLSELKN